MICAAGVNHLPGTACLAFQILFLSSGASLAQTSVLKEKAETFDSFFVRLSSFVLSPSLAETLQQVVRTVPARAQKWKQVRDSTLITVVTPPKQAVCKKLKRRGFVEL